MPMLDDPDLQRLLNAHEDQAGAHAVLAIDQSPTADSALQCLQEARDAVERYISANYVRRPQVIYPQEPEVGEFFENVDLGITQHWNGEQWVPLGRYRAPATGKER